MKTIEEIYQPNEYGRMWGRGKNMDMLLSKYSKKEKKELITLFNFSSFFTKVHHNAVKYSTSFWIDKDEKSFYGNLYKCISQKRTLHDRAGSIANFNCKKANFMFYRLSFLYTNLVKSLQEWQNTTGKSATDKVFLPLTFTYIDSFKYITPYGSLWNDIYTYIKAGSIIYKYKDRFIEYRYPFTFIQDIGIHKVMNERIITGSFKIDSLISQSEIHEHTTLPEGYVPVSEYDKEQTLPSEADWLGWLIRIFKEEEAKI